MAPSKRARPVEETVEVLESASSSLRRNIKRPRLSTPGGEDEEEDLLIEDGNGEYTATQRRLGGNRENYERERDEISEHEDDEDKVERATQDIRRQKQSQKRNLPADAGVIESVTCVNFMCHTNLHITLGPLINFIIGHNGSGKSAVLTAITLCLGGKATSTNRGQSLKSFIKEGEEKCTLTVKLKNQGDQAYRHDVYGDSIIVERSWTLTSSGRFHVKNANGKTISDKRQELDEITDFFALQLDNPVNVLTQDMARQFLNSSTEAEKYKFFIKGVQLEQLDNDYTLLSDSLDNADAQIDTIQDDLKQLEKKYQEAVRKFDLSQRQSNLRTKIGDLSRQMAWAQVEEQENNLAQLERKIEQAQALIERRQENSKTHEKAFDEATRVWEASKLKHEELVASLEPLKDEENESKEAFDKNKSELMELHTSQRSVKTDMDAEVKRAEKLQKEIDEEKQRLEAADGGAHASKLAEIEEAESLVPQAKEEFEQHKSNFPTLDRNVTTAEQKVNDIKQAVSSKTAEVENAKQRLQQLHRQQPDPLGAYHATIKGCLRAISMERRFREQPIGPMGNYVKLLKPEWSSIIESYFGGILSAFVVTNKHDQMILSDIMKKTSYRGGVIIGNSNPLDTAPNLPDARFDTLIGSLEITNELVRNQLIINQAIDQVILIKDRGEGNRVMLGDVPLHNVKVCLTFHERRGHGTKYTRGYAGAKKSDPVKAWEGGARMGTDTETQIRLQQDVVQGLKQELNEIEEQKRTFEDELNKARQAKGRWSAQEKALRLAFQRAEDRVGRLKQDLEAATPMDGKLDGLKSQLTAVQDMIDHYRRQFDESVAEKDRLDGLQNELKPVMDAAAAKVADTQKQIVRAKVNVTKLADARQKYLMAKNNSLGRVDDARKEKEELEGHRVDLAANVASFIEQASEVSPRVPVDRGETPATLDAKLHSMNDQIRRFEREIGGSDESIAVTARTAKEARDSSRKEFKDAEDLSDVMRMSLANRHFRWKRFRSTISTRARAGFTFLLSERDFKGRMLLDHKAKLLQLLVQPDSSRRGDEGRQTRTLSGGEKSYSTICLLLALWDAMGSPIRCLDEFDVFMDSVNRDVSMKMMIEAARGSVGRQFILITPQAMGSVYAADDVKIIRMVDPERGQTALNFGAAGAVAASS